MRCSLQGFRFLRGGDPHAAGPSNSACITQQILPIIHRAIGRRCQLEDAQFRAQTAGPAKPSADGNVLPEFPSGCVPLPSVRTAETLPIWCKYAANPLRDDYFCWGKSGWNLTLLARSLAIGRAEAYHHVNIYNVGGADYHCSVYNDFSDTVGLVVGKVLFIWLPQNLIFLFV